MIGLQILIVSIPLLCPSFTQELLSVKIDQMNSQDATGSSRRGIFDYFQEKKDNRNSPDIGNLDHLISLFISQNCLIIIDNPRHIDLTSMQQNPAMIRSRESLAAVKDNSGRRDLVFAPKILVGRNVSVVSGGGIDCPLSKFLVVRKDVGSSFVDICYHLYLPTIWRNIKPWNCQALVYLFPPAFYYFEYSLQAHQSEWRQEKFFRLTQFSNIFEPTIRVFIEVPSENNGSENHDLKWIQESVMYRKIDVPSSARTVIDRLCQEMFLLANTVLVSQSRSIEPPSSNIFNIELFGVCPPFKNFGLMKMFNQKVGINFRNKKLLENILPGPNSNLIWRIQHQQEEESAKVFKLLSQCGNMRPLPDKLWFSSRISWVEHGYADVWLSIMGNYTVVDSNGVKMQVQCSKDKSVKVEENDSVNVDLKFNPFPTNLYQFPYFIRNKWGTMRFVSCGKRGLTGIPFQELTNIFDKWIWVLILVYLLVPMVQLSFLSDKKIGSCRQLMSSIKVLLEQGNPFTETVASGRKTKPIVGTVLLAGIVLSNAYKNSNVYNMVIPRKPVPYEFFKELLQDKFTAYARISNILLSTKSNAIQTPADHYIYLAGNKSIELVKMKNGSALAVSEIAGVMNFLDLAYDKYLCSFTRDYHNILFTNTSLSKSGVLFEIKILNDVKDLLGQLFELTYRLTDAPESNYYIWPPRNETENLLALQEEMLLKKMIKCDNVALVLPDYLCHSYLRKLNKYKNLTHVFLGKVGYQDVEWMFAINGIIPVFLMKRLRSVHERGMWARWTKLVKELDSSVEKQGNGDLATPGLDGNIVLIFLLWLSGLVCSGAIYVSELGWFLIIRTSFL